MAARWGRVKRWAQSPERAARARPGPAADWIFAIPALLVQKASALARPPADDEPMPRPRYDETIEALIHNAEVAAANAYCPYSNFRVGAALIDQAGNVHTGCNVENASYSLTVCAERNAVCSGVARGLTQLHTIAIYTPTSSPTPPCGACRQVLAELGRHGRVICVCDGDGVIDSTISELFPHAFESRA